MESLKKAEADAEEYVKHHQIAAIAIFAVTTGAVGSLVQEAMDPCVPMLLRLPAAAPEPCCCSSCSAPAARALQLPPLLGTPSRLTPSPRSPH
jgi:hypothetical protein